MDGKEVDASSESGDTDEITMEAIEDKIEMIEKAIK